MSMQNIALVVVQGRRSADFRHTEVSEPSCWHLGFSETRLSPGPKVYMTEARGRGLRANPPAKERALIQDR